MALNHTETRLLIMEVIADLEEHLEKIDKARSAAYRVWRNLLDDVGELRNQIADLYEGLAELGGPIEETDADTA